jgi:hypothetical protein
MYTEKNFLTKKALKEAVANGEKVAVYQPGPFGYTHASVRDGRVFLEGPHFPQAHTWYAQAWLRDGYVVKVT